MAKTFLNIEEANKEIKRLRRQLCCCSTNCPPSQRIFYSDLITIDDPAVQVQIFLNGSQIYGDGGIDTQTAINNMNTNLAGLATFTHDGERVVMSSNFCADMTISVFPDIG